MKKLLFTLITIMPVFLFAQVNLGFGSGWDFRNHVPISNVYAGLTKGIFHADIEARPVISFLTKEDAFKSVYCGLRIGIDVLDKDITGISMIPSIGYYNNKVQSSYKDLNNQRFGYSVKFVYYGNWDNGAWFFDNLYINNSYQALIGWHYTFDKKDK